jgi:hypothetical protein
MSKKTRRRLDAPLKAKVALEARIGIGQWVRFYNECATTVIMSGGGQLMAGCQSRPKPRGGSSAGVEGFKAPIIEDQRISSWTPARLRRIRA